MTIPLRLVAAVARNGAIGGHGRLLWRLRSDMRRFRALTMGKPVIVGRKTWDSIGRPLPGRTIVAVTRDRTWRASDVQAAHSVEEAVAAAREIAARSGAGEAIVAGGAEIYAQTLAGADFMTITEVDVAPGDADAFFPDFDRTAWIETRRERPPREEGDDCAFAFVDYERIRRRS